MGRILTIWAMLAALFTRLGPAPEKGEGKDEGKAKDDDDDRPEGTEHNFFDEDPDDPDDPPVDDGKKDDGKEDSEEEDDEDEGDDDDEDGDDDDDEDDEDGDDDDLDTSAQLLDAKWEATLSAQHARGEGRQAQPTLALDKMALRKQARERFKEIREKDEEGAHDDEAIFEIAIDAAVQVMASYHYDHAAPEAEKMTKGLRNAQVNARLGTFNKSAGEALTPKIEKRMAAIYTAKAEKYGWRNADAVPFDQLFKMAGGTMPKKGKGSKAKRQAERQKAKDLGATHTPRRVTGGAPKRGKKLSADEKRERSGDEAARKSMEPFFSMGI